MMDIQLLGIDHKSSPVEIRETVTFPDIDQAHRTLIQHTNIHECLIVSTCNRSEIYAVIKSDETSRQTLRSFFYDYHHLQGTGLDAYFYERDTTQAVNHLMRVTSSLEAMMVGEPQVTGQVKSAYRSASVNNCIGKLLHKLVHASFKANKEIRSSTEISVGAVSVSLAACKLAQKILGPLGNKRAIMIGAGEMMRTAAAGLSDLKVGGLTFANRTNEKASELAKQFSVESVPWETLSTKASQFDIVFCATNAPQFILNKKHIEEVMRARKNSPLFIVDLSVPRSIEPSAGDLLNVFLYNVDDLNTLVADNLKKREAAVHQAREIVKSHADAYLGWLGSLDADAMLGRLSASFNSVRDRELAFFDTKLRSLPEAQQQLVYDLSNRMVKKIFHSIAKPLKEEKNEYEKIRLLAVIGKIFRV
jgi:glutamyl-tRNA reductase